jgi:hypothetical protein
MIEDIATVSQLFNKGWMLYEVMNAVGFTGDHNAFRDAVRMHGYVVTRMVVESGAPPRTWGLKKQKLTIKEVKQIDRWLGTEYLTLAGIVRLVRLHGISPIRHQDDLMNILFRSGYSWQYGLITVDQERKEMNEEE